ncbi:hypothetical protein CGC21_5155 [Leishmania donovani]|uniref:Phosphoglycan beta 1,3 galactosyltransferase n=1 Tax=Leishmania donovani TaxID=5661 RepID=A0A504XB87_LEIDO|nr:hypothetical protein CGC21_5155 [Leishmania donovani]
MDRRLRPLPGDEADAGMGRATAAASTAERMDAAQAAAQATTAPSASNDPQLQSVDTVRPGAVGMPAPPSDPWPGEPTLGLAGRDCRPQAPFAAARRGTVVIAVFSAIYGVAFNGRDMTPPKNRDVALALKRASDCLLTQTRLPSGLTLCSAISRYERAMDPIRRVLLSVLPSISSSCLQRSLDELQRWVRVGLPTAAATEIVVQAEVALCRGVIDASMADGLPSACPCTAKRRTASSSAVSTSSVESRHGVRSDAGTSSPESAWGTRRDGVLAHEPPTVVTWRCSDPDPLNRAAAPVFGTSENRIFSAYEGRWQEAEALPASLPVLEGAATVAGAAREQSPTTPAASSAQGPSPFSLTVCGPTAVTAASLTVTAVSRVPKQVQEVAAVSEDEPTLSASGSLKPSRSYSRGRGSATQLYQCEAVGSSQGVHSPSAGGDAAVLATPHGQGRATAQPPLTMSPPALAFRANAEHMNTVGFPTPSPVARKAVAATAAKLSYAARSSASLSYNLSRLLRLCFLRRWCWRAWRVSDSGLLDNHLRRTSGSGRGGGMTDNYFDGDTDGDGSSHRPRSTKAEPRYSVGRLGDCDDDDYYKGRSVSALSRLLMTLWGRSCSAPTQEGGGGRAPTTTAAATRRRRRGMTTRRRNTVIVATENTTENAMFAAVVCLLESEELFIARMQYVGLPVALHPPTHTMAVLLQQPTVPPTLVSLRRVSVLPRNGGSGGAAEAGPAEVEGMSKSVLRQLFDRYRTRSAALAMEGLRLSYAQRHPRLFFFLSSRTLTASQVPSWTLHVVEDGCTECLQGQGYAEAVKGMAVELDQTSPRTAGDDNVSRAAPSQVQGAVFATSNAPLGRIGPMLLAMASVTDDVEVAAELRKWRWLAPVRASEAGKDSPRAPRGSSKCASSTPYLAVLGIPSTDQPARVALREAQRQTWFKYHEVARTETGFDGALLPLYIFGAVEWPALTRQPTGAPVAPSSRDDGERSVRGGGKAAGKPAHLDAAYVSIDSQRLSANPSLLLPHIHDLAAAVELRTATLAAAAGATITADQDAPLLEMPTVTQRRRRMTLRPSWRNERSTDSPCDAIVDQTVRMTVASATPPSLPLLQVAQRLSLPVAPLVTAPARLVCYASSALWQEALERRDSLWIDMLTDRRPATGKTVGGEGKWGLRVEVGMSQKLILWLMYAYCTFPEVPFIMKGDDDTYIKVPQYLSDIRYLWRGRKTRVPPPHDVDTEHGTVENAQLTKSTEECVYWGSMRRWNGEVYFSAGMLLLLHRRLVQTVVEVRTEFNNDVLYLAAADYSAAYAHSYYASMMDHEDVMLGKLLMERRFRADRLCPFRRHWYVWEDLQRFHDLHRGRVRNVTWASVALHRCRPADAYYLHYFFAQEYRYSGSRGAAERSAEGGQEGDAILCNARAERAARQAAQSWVADRLRSVLQAGGNVAEGAARKLDAAALTAAEEEAGWSSLPDVLWAVQRDRSVHTPPYLSDRDGVAIDDVEYVPFSDGVLVLNGLKARILS